MSAPAVAEPPVRLFGDGTDRSFAPRRRGITLEERLDASWRALAGEGEAACPVCRAHMRLCEGAGHCDGCGSQLT